jgi:hypothetical protein
MFVDLHGHPWLFHADGSKTRLDRLVEPSSDPWAPTPVDVDPWGA